MADIYVYDVIGRGLFEDGVTADGIRGELENAGGDDVTVRINSPGGDVFEGLAIRTLLEAYSGAVNVIVDGLAASAATVVMLAGDSIKMAAGAMLMIHDPWAVTLGNEAEHIERAGVLGKAANNLAGLYAAVGNQSAEAFREIMQAETWLTADEAIELGLAEAESGEKVKACAVPEGFGYKNTPKNPFVQPIKTLDLAAMARKRKIDLTRGQMIR